MEISPQNLQKNVKNQNIEQHLRGVSKQTFLQHTKVIKIKRYYDGVRTNL